MISRFGIPFVIAASVFAVSLLLGPRAADAQQALRDCDDGCPEMVTIPAGTHTMFAESLPHAKVTVPRFAIGRTPVTQAQWRAIMGNNPSSFGKCGDACPVEQVSWDDAQAYAKRLSQKTGHLYRLPSEAEWEYACMAGQTTAYCGGDTADDVAWYGNQGKPGGNSGMTTHPVAQKKPNAWGLYDMSGNVSEWQLDCWKKDCGSHDLRGGSWQDDAKNIVAAVRTGDFTGVTDPTVGFRVAMTLP
jgi:formylglycine-generating enzyme required for sulfatase activity